MSLILFTNATLLDCTGGDPVFPAWVVAEDGVIREVGTGSAPHIAGAETTDCGGKTLMPGLIDGHMHASLFTNDLGELHRKILPSTACFRAAKILEDTLMQGFTTVRDAGGIDAGFREAQKQGLITAPKMQVCGRAISMTGGHADPRLPTEIAPPVTVGMLGVIADGVDEVRKAAREQLRLGADYIKVMAGGGCASAADEPDTVQYSPEELAAIVYEAKARQNGAHPQLLHRSMKMCAERESTASSTATTSTGRRPGFSGNTDAGWCPPWPPTRSWPQGARNSAFPPISSGR
jgi:imidazolonepropionase-like amidohydrolase